MKVLEMRGNRRGQISIDFITVYSVVLVIFVLVFVVMSGQRATVLNAQQSSIAGIEAQEIASYIDHAISAGSGYMATLSLAQGPGTSPYNIYISTTGVVIINSSAGGQPVNAYAFSDGKNMSINGSLQFGSSNGIGTYLVPSYTGVIRISNIGGTVYIDRGPVSNAGLLGSSILTDVQEGYASNFNSLDQSYINITSNSAINPPSALTILAFVDPTSYPSGGNYYAVASKWGQSAAKDQYIILITSTGTVLVALGNNLDESGHATTQTIPLNTWSEVGLIYTGSEEEAVINGQVYPLFAVTGSSVPTNPIPFDIGAEVGVSRYFQGSISDVQLYNNSLTAAQIGGYYSAGPLASPISQNGLAGWWPLDGNSNDYSGNSDNGQYTNLNFLTSARLLLDVLARNGTGLSNVPIGIVISNGIVGGSPFAAYGTSSNGVYTPTLLYNSINPNATVYSYDGNLSIAGNLIGWWPLSFGDLAGNGIYDISPGNDNGIYNGITSWGPWTLNRHFAAASFTGNGMASAITVNAMGSLLNVSSSKNFTAVAWVDYTGGTAQSQPCGGVFGSGGVSANGIQLMTRGMNANCGVFYAGGNALFGNYVIPLNSTSWTMLSSTWAWNGVAGDAYVFQNANIVASGWLRMGSNSIAPSNGQYYIGAQSAAGVNSFNGLVSDVQLYSQTLSQAQMAQLYSEGPAGIPILGAGLDGWWPLTATAADYSGGNTGSLAYNAAFGAANYTFSYNTTPTAKVATFSGLGGIKINTGGGIPFTGPFSVSLWFSTSNSPSTPFDYELLDAKLNSGGSSNAYDLQLCGGRTCYGGVTGFNGVVGTGSAVLSNTIYPFQFVTRRQYNVVETFSTTGWTMYLNGANVSSGSYSGTPEIAGSSDYIMVGGGSTTASDFYGQIADVQVYNAVLTSAEARQIYQQGVSPQGSVTLSMG